MSRCCSMPLAFVVKPLLRAVGSRALMPVALEHLRLALSLSALSLVAVALSHLLVKTIIFFGSSLSGGARGVCPRCAARSDAHFGRTSVASARRTLCQSQRRFLDVSAEYARHHGRVADHSVAGARGGLSSTSLRAVQEVSDGDVAARRTPARRRLARAVAETKIPTATNSFRNPKPLQSCTLWGGSLRPTFAALSLALVHFSLLSLSPARPPSCAP